jgi:hypothetical protein
LGSDPRGAGGGGNGIRRIRALEEAGAQSVLVETSGLGDPPLERVEGG